MTNNTTIIVVITLVFYFIIVGFIFNAIGQDIPISDSNSENLQFCKKVNVVTLSCTEYTVFGNVVTSIESLPIWANTIFLIIPFALLLVFIVLLFIHG